MVLSEDGETRWDDLKGEWVPAMPESGAPPIGASSNLPTNPTLTDEIISDGSWSKTVVTVFITAGFLMLIISSSYNFLSNYSPSPGQSDFDVDNSGGLDNSENENYSNAVELHGAKMKLFEGLSILFAQIGPGLICMGLLYLCIHDVSKEMPKGLRITLMICTFYMIVNLLGFHSGISGALGFGFGE